MSIEGSFEGSAAWQQTKRIMQDIVERTGHAVEVRITKLPTGEQGVRVAFMSGIVSDNDRMIAEFIAAVQGPKTRIVYEPFDDQTRFDFAHQKSEATDDRG